MGQNSRPVSFFRGCTTPFRRRRRWCQSKDSKCQHLRPVSGFVHRPRQSCQRSPAANIFSYPVERPSHRPPGMILHSNPLAVNHLPSAGRLKHCISNRTVISKDPWVLETVQGFHLDLVSIPHQLSILPTVHHTKENKALIDLEIPQMLEKEAIHVFSLGELHQGFVSSILLVPKTRGGQGPVLNLGPLNPFIPYEHFKMEGIPMLKDMLRKGDFMVKIDLKDAYFTVRVWQNHQTFLMFVRKETIYEFACLPFGLASAPRVYTKLLKPVVRLLRQLGIRLIVYLDNMLIMGQPRTLPFNMPQLL